MSNDEDIKSNKGLVIFGRDVSRIPCFRNSFLYGIGGGIATGLAFFMFTSRPRMACHVSVAAFSVITLAYWSQCRYQYSKSKFEMLRMQELIRQQNVFEGSQAERELNSMIQTDDV